MKKYIAILLLLSAGCVRKSGQSSSDNSASNNACTVGFKPTTSYEMASFDTVKSNDARTVRLLLDEFISDKYPDAKATADSALHIASVLLSSADFKAAITKFDFTCENYWTYCEENCADCEDRFKGSIVLDSVFRQKEVKLNLYLNKCGHEYGHAERNIYKIFSCQKVVFKDEKKLTPAYCYAYHLAHEYMHIVGFFHTDHIDDVAEKTGWIGWEILLEWRQKGIDVMHLQPGQI